MELKTKIMLFPVVFFVIYNVIRFVISGKFDLFGGIFIGVVTGIYLWHTNKKEGKI